eukprot:GEMP01045459.1.p1 GENE.GEMP01045459.1~~GEMP01045459.1.p1  ORF type:complete len:462 (+),score=60.01 GEMP01045459.1:192-1577(+)
MSTSTDPIWTLCYAQCLAYFSCMAGRACIFAVVSSFEREFDGWESETTGVCLAVGNLAHLVTAMSQGLILDRVHSGLLTVLCMSCVSIGVMALAFSPSPVAAMVAYAAIRIFATPTWAAQGRIIREEYEVADWEQAWTWVSISSRAALLLSVSVINMLLSIGLGWRSVTFGVAVAIASATFMIAPQLLSVGSPEEGAYSKRRPLMLKLTRMFECFEFWLVVIINISSNVLFEFLGFSKMFMRQKFHVSDQVASLAPGCFLLGQVLSLIACAMFKRQLKGGAFIIMMFVMGCIGLLNFCWIAHSELEPSPHVQLVPIDTILVREEVFLLDKAEAEMQVSQNLVSATTIPSSFIFGIGLSPASLLPSALWITHFGRDDDTTLMVGITDAIGYFSAAVFDRLVGVWRSRAGTVSNAWQLIFDVMLVSAVFMIVALAILFFNPTGTLRKSSASGKCAEMRVVHED